MFDFFTQLGEELGKAAVLAFRKLKNENKIIYNILSFTFLALPIGLVLTLFFINEKVDFFGLKTSFSTLIAISTGILTVISLLVSYINPSDYKSKPASYKDQYYINLQEAYIRLLNQVKHGSESSSDKIDIDKIIKEKLAEHIDQEFSSFVENKYGDAIIKAQQIERVEMQIKELQSGVNVQIDKLSRNGTVNLLIGLATTITAIAMLLSLISDIKGKVFADTSSLIIYLAPRTTLAVFIEVFSFFFLKLYKSNLEDIKYFHNERTNIDSKVIALKSAFSLSKEETLIEVIRAFSTVERNFILKKDESTTDIEKLRISNQQSSDFLAKIADIIDKSKK